MYSLIVLFPALFFPAFSIAISASHNDPKFSWSLISHVLAFGDSYTYVQGIEGRQNYSFIGDALNFSYSPEQLRSDSIVQNQIGTSAGGPNWVEYLTGCYSGLPAGCNGSTANSTRKEPSKQKQLWDFAFAGADISEDYLPLHHNYTVALDRQVEQWNTYARPYLPVKPEEGLAAIWIGINDVSDSATNSSISSFATFYSDIVSAAFASASAIADAGYKYFLIMQLPPIDRTPGNIANAAAGRPLTPNTTQIAEYNSAIASSAKDFATQHDVETFVFDTYSFLGEVIDNAADYGIMNTTGYCPRYDAPDISVNYTNYGCLPISEYFWYNTGHITYHVHEILAAKLQTFLKNQS